MASHRHRLRQRLHVGQEPQPAAGAEVAPRVDLGPFQTHGTPGPVQPTCTACPVDRSMCSARAMPARAAVASTAPAGTVRRQSSPRRARIFRSMGSPGCFTPRRSAWTAMICPTNWAGAGQDRVSTIFTPRAVSDAQGWCRVMAYSGSVLVRPVMLEGAALTAFVLGFPRRSKAKEAQGAGCSTPPPGSFRPCACYSGPAFVLRVQPAAHGSPNGHVHPATDCHPGSDRHPKAHAHAAANSHAAVERSGQGRARCPLPRHGRTGLDEQPANG